MMSDTTISADGSERITVHYLIGALTGKPRIACMPSLESFSATPVRDRPFIRSDDVRAVNCKLCSATKEFKSAAQGVLW